MNTQAISRVIFQKFLYLRFLIFQRHRHNKHVIEQIDEKPFVILPGVFNPTLFFSSKFFVESFTKKTIPLGSKVLDLGTGSGFAGIFASKWAEKVTAVDVNPAAVRCARINAILNGVENMMTVLEGDLFAPVSREQFDVILFNPPYLPGKPKSDLENAFYSEEIAERFGRELPRMLIARGHALVVLSDIGNETDFLQAWKSNGLTIEIFDERKLPGETLKVYKIYQ